MKLEHYQFLKDLISLVKGLDFIQKAVGATGGGTGRKSDIK